MFLQILKTLITMYGPSALKTVAAAVKKTLDSKFYGRSWAQPCTRP